MSTRCIRAIFVAAAIHWLGPGRVDSAVIVLTNQTARDINCTVLHADGKPLAVALGPGQLRPIPVSGEVDIAFAANRATRQYRVKPNSIYYFTEQKELLDLQQAGIGQEPDPHATPAATLRPVDQRLAAGVLTVKILVDDKEPGTQRVWEPRLRQQIQTASEILRRHGGPQLEVVATGIWRTDERIADLQEAVLDFERKTASAPAQLAIGFPRQYRISPDAFARSGGLRSPLGSHMLIPDPSERTGGVELQKMLVHELGHFLGATHSPDPTSIMRSQLASPRSSERMGAITFDPLNTLVMSLVTEEVRRRGVRRLAELSPPIRQRVADAYAVTAQALPDDPIARALAQANPAGKPSMIAGPPVTPADDLRGSAAKVPRLKEIAIPDFPGACAVWGAIGRDADQNIWFAVSAEGSLPASARLFRFAPATGATEDCGDVVTQLRAAARYRDREQHGIICSAIVQAADGQLYFASIGEAGAATDPSRPPPWGSHLWRFRPASRKWEHLATMREGLVAVASHGERLYALGYPGNVVYRYDLRTGKTASVVVGPALGCVCRDLPCDQRGHVYVPRLRKVSTAGDPGQVDLVELDGELREVAETPLMGHPGGLASPSCVIVAHARMRDATEVFLTQGGAVYRLLPCQAQPAEVRLLEEFDKQGGFRFTGMAVDASGRYLVAAAMRQPSAVNGVQWFVYDLAQRRFTVHPIANSAEWKHLQLHGSGVSAIQGGAMYLAGMYARGPLQVPPRLLELLKTRGCSEAQLARLQENAKRTSQPLLFSVSLEP